MFWYSYKFCYKAVSLLYELNNLSFLKAFVELKMLKFLVVLILDLRIFQNKLKFQNHSKIQNTKTNKSFHFIN